MSTRDATDLRRASRRLGIQFGVLFLVVFAVLLSLTYLIVRSSQADETTHILMDAAQSASVDDAPRDILIARSDHGVLTVSPNAPSWFPVSSQLSAAAGSHAPVSASLTKGGRSYSVISSSHDGLTVQTARDNSENVGELQRLAVALTIAGLVGTIASALIAAFMAFRSLRPMADALALQRRFVADASHELRTPLTLLTTRAQLLRRAAAGQAPGKKKLVDGLDEILRDSRELTDILEDLLIAADPRESTERTPLDLAQLGRDAVESLALPAQDRGIGLTAPATDVPVIVDGSRTPLLRLFTSLISNAIDHAHSTVTVTVIANGTGAEIRVGDDGGGFSPDLRDRAFERFSSTRAGSSDEATTRHYGLGLALVAEVAARHGGDVRVEPSEPGTGAIIVVTLPLGSQMASTASPQAS